MSDLSSGRLASVALKAAPAKETAKPAGGAKGGSWGKPGPKAKAAAAATPASGDRVILSNASSGFEIPVSTTMFEAARV